MIEHLASGKTIFDAMDHQSPWTRLGVGAALVTVAFLINLLTKKDENDNSNMGCLSLIVGIVGIAMVLQAI